tara:strand:- start:175 stop:555 length:381 start_codon:yes stop_codon:yes gene_type:complete
MNDIVFYDLLSITKDVFRVGDEFPHYTEMDASGLPIFADGCRITTEEFKLEFEKQEKLYPLHKLRPIRNELLAQTDWIMLRDVKLENMGEWETYRQQLRDLPKTQTNLETDEMGNLLNVEYPTKPH